MRPTAALLLLPLLAAGCSAASTAAAVNSAGPIAGAAAGIGLGAVTANPLVAYAAGVGTQAAVTALQKYLSRKLQQGEQDRIAQTIAAMQPGQVAPWKISYALPPGPTEHGDVTVTRVMATALATCKEVAFTVIAGHKPDAPRAIYLTTACADSDGAWHWAEAEPATARWGFLQ